MASRRVAVITDGLVKSWTGLQITRRLIPQSKTSWTLYATGRTSAHVEDGMAVLKSDTEFQKALEESGSELKEVELDYASTDAVEKFKSDLVAKHGEDNLSVLINVATSRGPINRRAATIDQAPQIVDGMYFGIKSLTQALLPLMRRDETSRVVNLTSAHGRPRSFVSSLRQDFSSVSTFEELEALMAKYKAATVTGPEEVLKEGWLTGDRSIWDPQRMIHITRMGIAAQALLFAKAKENEGILINCCTSDTRPSEYNGFGSRTALFLALENINGANGLFFEDKMVAEW
ncbi:hypothetical protein AA313_de0207651 [Arthrobotrys entomopaga]|nr:hypothetical protein AA313_de0207651 [Arthrobotrys entomopaga]